MKVNIYQQALDAQNAVNLSGVVHSWHLMLDQIWVKARVGNHGTDWVNEHPVNVLMANKVAALAGLNQCVLDADILYENALKECETKAKELANES